jgi:predicted ATPase
MTEITLWNLDVSAVNSILMDLPGMDGDKSATLGLASLCHRQTDGNAFFVVAFISMLKERDLLEYNFGLMRWVWNESSIEEKTVAAINLVDLITTKMRTQLQDEVEEILQLAALLGAQFAAGLVSVLWEEMSHRREAPTSSKRREARELLQDAVEQSFLEKANESSIVVYRWVHDKIQEAAISMIPLDEIGLMAKLSGDELDSSIFIVCNLLNAGAIPAHRTRNGNPNLLHHEALIDTEMALIDKNIDKAKESFRLAVVRAS